MYGDIAISTGGPGGRMDHRKDPEGRRLWGFWKPRGGNGGVLHRMVFSGTSSGQGLQPPGAARDGRRGRGRLFLPAGRPEGQEGEKIQRGGRMKRSRWGWAILLFLCSV